MRPIKARLLRYSRLASEEFVIVRAIKTGADLPPDDLISAVFLIALQSNHILSVRNERGWDLPGGHIERGETPVSALAREVMEEASATFRHVEPCSIIAVPPRMDVMLFFATDAFELWSFSPTVDAIEREVMPVELLLDRYYGRKEVLRQVLNNAQSVIRSSRRS